MDERIRVEVTESSPHGETTYAAEALSPKDAVRAVVATVEEYEEELMTDG